MQRHPREDAKGLRESMERRLGRPVTRREFLRASTGAAVGLPALSAILAACSNPRENTTSGFEVATKDNPVTLDLVGESIADGLEPEVGATLQIYNWDLYIWHRVVQEFCDTYDCDYEITTFNNMEEAISKIQTGQLKLDIFFPTYDQLGKLVVSNYLQPLNHSYIPNLEGANWDIFKNPFYDQGWRYSVPYTVYTTGIAYRRDRLASTLTGSDDLIYGMSNPYEILWDSQYSGAVGIYNSYRDAIAMVLLKNGITDVNTEKPEDLQVATADLLQLVDNVNVRRSINGAYAKLPKGEFTLHQSWSGDIVAGWGYVTDYVESQYENLGYWYPDDRVGVADNDLIAIPSSAEHPVLAHLFLNWMLDHKHAMDNFSWNGYQPPQKQGADAAFLTTTEGRFSKLSAWAAPVPYVPPWMTQAVVLESDLTDTGYRIHELSPEGDALWHDAWQEFNAGR